MTAKPMKILLTEEESNFLRRYIKEHLEYYLLLSGSSHMSARNRDQHEFILTLWNKLNGNK